MADAIAMYRVTSSEVEFVKVDSLLIDDDEGERRSWLFYGVGHPLQGPTLRAASGVRTDRLCTQCWHAPERTVAAHGHDHPHGDGPRFVPSEVP